MMTFERAKCAQQFHACVQFIRGNPMSTASAQLAAVQQCQGDVQLFTLDHRIRQHPTHDFSDLSVPTGDPMESSGRRAGLGCDRAALRDGQHTFKRPPISLSNNQRDGNRVSRRCFVVPPLRAPAYTAFAVKESGKPSPIGLTHALTSLNAPTYSVVHLENRRGHFAHYTEDRPLFGKYTGTFYHPMHVRGRAERGVVVKDYRVHPSKAVPA